MLWYTLLIVAVAVERIAELVVSKRNWVWSKERGGSGLGAGHYPVMVVLHVGLLAGCLVEPLVADRPFIPALGWPMLVVVLGAQGLRWWCQHLSVYAQVASRNFASFRLVTSRFSACQKALAARSIPGSSTENLPVRAKESGRFSFFSNISSTSGGEDRQSRSRATPSE
jgi:hypothetical protein